MTEKTSEAARIDRLFLIAFVPLVIYMCASLYVRVTTDEDPLWAELATPLFFAVLGLRSIVRPTTPEARKASRALGIMLVAAAAVLLVLILYNSQGAN